ncbi:MAG: hypothetical protein MK110_02105 [Fuerstiella sp.]|nr:hypothetical protein [Fuerstiella sp.]
MIRSSDESPSIMKFIGGVLLGIVMTFVYVRYSWKMPEVTTFPGKITEAAIVTTAGIDLFRPEAGDDVRRRAFSIVMSQKSDELVEIDRELGSPLMEELLRRKAFRQTKLIRHQMSGYETVLNQPALRKALETKHGKTEDDEQLKRQMLLSAIHEEEYTSWYLRTRFPQLVPSDWIDLVMNVYENELRPETRVAAQPNSVVR